MRSLRAIYHLRGVMIRCATVCVSVALCFGCAVNPEADHLLEKGLAAVESFDFLTGVRLLSEVQPDVPEDDPRWVEITYALALAAWHAGPPRAEWIELAQTLFEKIARREGDSPVGMQARLNLARLAEIVDYPGDTPDFETAKAMYRELISEETIPDLAIQAALRLANLEVFSLTADGARSAIATIQARLERDPESEWASVAWQYIGDIYAIHLGDKAAALDAYEKAYALGFVNPLRADSYVWRMGQFAEQLGRFESALKWYRVILSDYPRSMYGTWARQRIERLAPAAEGAADLASAPGTGDVL